MLKQREGFMQKIRRDRLESQYEEKRKLIMTFPHPKFGRLECEEHMGDVTKGHSAL